MKWHVLIQWYQWLGLVSLMLSAEIAAVTEQHRLGGGDGDGGGSDELHVFRCHGYTIFATTKM